MAQKLQFLTVFLLSALVSLGHAQNACEPIDDGPFLATLPTLNFMIDEATDEDIQNAMASGSTKYQSELRIHGTTSDFTLTRSMNFQFIDPFEYFEFVTEGGKNYMRLKKGLDRDGMTSAPEDDISFVPFTLICSPKDTSLENKTYDARIFINDVNDNVPVFPSDNKTIVVTISEATPVGTVVFTAQAQDKDANLDKNMTYSLLDHNDIFSMDPLTGDVTLTSELDYDSLGNNKFLDLTLTVEDGGPDPVHTVTTTARINVVDADDHDPAFVYQGCWTHAGICAWPKYTTGLTLKKDEPIVLLPVPNKGQGAVKIQAEDSDSGVGNEIVFKIASTIPPGHENEFRVETYKGLGNIYGANVIPLSDMIVDDGFEIFLKAEEQSATMKHEIAMIFFTGGASGASSQGQGSNNNNDTVDSGDDDSSYSDLEVALIVVISILAAFLLCALIALIYACRRRGGSKKEAAFSMGETNGGFNQRL